MPNCVTSTDTTHCAAFETSVVIGTAQRIGVAINFKIQFGILGQLRRDLFQHRRGFRFQAVAIGIEFYSVGDAGVCGTDGGGKIRSSFSGHAHSAQGDGPDLRVHHAGRG